MNGPELASLQQGEQIDGVYLLSRKSIPTTKNGKPFGALTLSDRSGQMDAKLWDQAGELLGPLQEGQAVRISGRVDSYQGKRQIVLNSIAEDSQADPSDFLPASPVPLEELKARLAEARTRVRNKDLKRLLKRVFQDDKEFLAAFERAPAAKGAHHAYVHGLLEHTVGVAGMAQKTVEQYPQLQGDLLITGALLHDIGKAEELTLGPPLGYTDQGRLEGHIVLGVRMLDRHLARMKDFPPELAGHLRHMILSHHGLYEFGSPKKPKTLEALALHFIDDFDAKLAMFSEVISSSQDENGNWSPFNRLLERFIYVGPSPLPQDQPSREAEIPPSMGLFEGLDDKGGE